MCGIAGILGAQDDNLCGSMLDRIAHRGPDGSGTWTGTGVTLGHRRLAILDVEHGQQPMTDATGRYTIVYNGECYNHLEIRDKLKADGFGYDFATTTDTETVLAGFTHWGPEILGHMEGMFAFAIWDESKQKLFVARDPWGIKPFFWATTSDGRWLFASEQKAILADAEISATPDIDRIKERAILEFLTGQSTLLADIHQLPAGTYAYLQPGDQNICWVPYYQVQNVAYDDVEGAVLAIRDNFVQSVREQLLSDVPLGVILSGGLDSAAVAAAYATKLTDQPIDTFTIAESEEIADFKAARGLAEQLGSNHREFFFDFEDVLKGMPKFTYHNENINYTEFFFMPLFDGMAKHVKVGLCGQGSDELWGGYSRYENPLQLARQRLEKLYQCRPRHSDDLAAQIAMTHNSGSALAEWDQQGQLANFQLRLVDRNSMAASLEVRVPFLSRPLHAASRAVPWGWKRRGDVEKWVLRKGLQDIGLPDELVWRKKVPAGRATSPTAMARFEAEAATMVDAKLLLQGPMAGAFGKPAEYLLYKLWEELYVHRRGEYKEIDIASVA